MIDWFTMKDPTKVQRETSCFLLVQLRIQDLGVSYVKIQYQHNVHRVSLILMHGTEIKRCIILLGSHELIQDLSTGCSGSKYICCVCKWQRNLKVTDPASGSQLDICIRIIITRGKHANSMVNLIFISHQRILSHLTGIGSFLGP